MNKLDIKKIVIIVMIYILIIGIIIFIDTLNISGVISNKLNYNFLNIVVNILTTILLFCITYILVERKLIENENKKARAENEKYNNKKIILLMLLKKTYKECQTNIDLIDNQKNLNKYIIPKIDFNSTNDKILNNFRTLPFESIENNMSTFIDGTIPYSYFEEYLDIKEMYRQFVNMRIIFFDAKEKRNKDMIVHIDSLKNILIELIKTQLEHIETEINLNNNSIG
ncbi:MAG: hypothetical protein ACI4WW_01170 [Candidatus Coprovivens sp.]